MNSIVGKASTVCADDTMAKQTSKVMTNGVLERHIPFYSCDALPAVHFFLCPGGGALTTFGQWERHRTRISSRNATSPHPVEFEPETPQLQPSS